MEPPPSLACAIGRMRPATAAAVPPEEPPGVRSGFHGLCVFPKRTDSGEGERPSSGVVVFPKMTSPAFLYRSTSVLSKSGTFVWNRRLPFVVAVPES
jgi:hypothetical protein